MSFDRVGERDQPPGQQHADKPAVATPRAPLHRRHRAAVAVAVAGALAITTAAGIAFLGRGAPAGASSSISPPAAQPQSLQPPRAGSDARGWAAGPELGEGAWTALPETAWQSSGTSVATASEEAGLVEIRSRRVDGTSAGTGMVLTSDGAVVTNHHVVEGAVSIRATVVSTGKTYRARYVGSDARRDVAVLHLVGATGLTTVELSTATPRSGARVTAVGDAGGDGGALTAASGTVVKRRVSITVDDDSGPSHRLHHLIKVAAELVPGDSGGALLDAGGNVVGMNVAASTGRRVGFAIPTTTVERVFDAVMSGDESGSVSIGYDGYLGVALYGASTAVVAAVADGSAAAQAGIQPGSTIVSVNGVRTATAGQLSARLRAHRPGDTVRIAWRAPAGQRLHAAVTLRRAPVT